MAETMAPQRVKRIMQYTPEQFCKVNKEQNIRRMYLREIQEHIDATDETLTEISKNSLPEELRHFKNELGYSVCQISILWQIDGVLYYR